jgi:hypothetical protein
LHVISFNQELPMTDYLVADPGDTLSSRPVSHIILTRTVAVVLAVIIAFMGLARAASAATAAEHRDSFSAMLMKNGIEAYSSASGRGDQKAADALLDDDVLFSAGDGAVQRDEKRDKSDAISALLQRQAQAMFDAAERGDRAALGRYLDPASLLVDDDGKVLTRRDVAGIAPVVPAAGMSASDNLTQWVAHHSGNVAVASFVDEQLVHTAALGERGQVLRPRYLVVQTWVERGATWKLIGSQAIALHRDPPVAMLPVSAWDEYTGSYSVAPGVTAVLASDGDALTSSTNGAKPVRYVPESVDVFFSPGMVEGALRPHIFFRRDETGHISGYRSSSGAVLARIDGVPTSTAVQPSAVKSEVLPAQELVVRRAGDVAVATFIHERITQYYGQVLHTRYRSTETWIKRGQSWKMLALQSRALENDDAAPPLAVPEMNDYVGTYVIGGDDAVTITLQAGSLLAMGKNGKPVVLNPLARDFFVPAGSPRTSIVFQRDASGRVAGYLIRREGRDLMFARSL